mgnify:FL=1
MPRFSIVIPVYNGAEYLEECVASVLDQDFGDFEVILVDDGSTDGSLEVEESLSTHDSRVTHLSQRVNGGTLLARKQGVMSSSGEYVLLMDQDDSIVQGTLSRLNTILADNPVDILHFGVEIVADNSGASEALAGMTAYLTPTPRALAGEDILSMQFAEMDGFDWNVHHKAYRGELARTCWSEAENMSLTLSDDLYMSFILASRAQSYLALADSPWYVYHLGRGETFGAKVDLPSFLKTSERDSKAYSLVVKYADGRRNSDRIDWGSRLSDVRDRLVEHVANEMNDKLGLENWAEALSTISAQWDADALAGELFRLIRDKSYEYVAARSNCAPKDRALELLLNAVQALDVSVTEEGSLRYRAMKDAALTHLRELGLCAPRVRRHIALFSTTHKEVDVPQANCIIPVQVGNKTTRYSWAAQDDTGDNIAELNPMYCELTTQWWAWKNVRADYYGFCHYRRYFDFSDERHLENSFGEIIDQTIDWNAQARYGLDDVTIASVVEGLDVLTTEVKDFSLFPGRYKNPLDHYAHAPHLRVDDLRRVMSITEGMYPDFAQDIQTFLSGSKSCFCNMFIMSEELFDRYCSWLFPILERFVSEWDCSTYSHEGLRTPGHLSERLLNVFLLHERRVNQNLRWKQLQCVHFERPERSHIIRIDPCEAAGSMPSIPVVFAADNNYVPMLTTTIFSMLRNADPNRIYDITVLEKDISPRNQSMLIDFLARFENARVRFCDVSGSIRAYNLRTNNEHISVETYYRFLIQDVLPDYDKVVYLDSDLIVLGDIAELFETELCDNLVAAARDIDFLGNLNMPDGKRMTYARETLGMKNPYDYFQAGVLVLNTAQMRNLHPIERWLEIASDSKYIYDDQDILNAECQGRVVYLDNAWNVMNDCGGRIRKVFSFAPADIFDTYIAAYENPKVIHYAGFEKPWKPGSCDYSELYWSYARQTPFYETLLKLTSKGGTTNGKTGLPPRAIGEDSAFRALDPLLPLGSRRREIAKALVRKMRGRD